MAKKQKKTNGYEIFSRIVADMSSPVVLSAFFFAFVCIKIIPDPIEAMKVFLVCFIAYSILPLLYLLGAYRFKFIPDIHLYEKTDRNKVFPAIAIFYLTGLMVLYKISAPTLIIGLAFSTTAMILIIWWVNLFYKISIHTSGIAGMLVGLFFVFGAYPSTSFVPFLPLAGWVRYRNKAHRFSELAIGAVTGAFVTGMVMRFLFP
jgi:hypothetical protein